MRGKRSEHSAFPQRTDRENPHIVVSHKVTFPQRPELTGVGMRDIATSCIAASSSHRHLFQAQAMDVLHSENR